MPAPSPLVAALSAALLAAAVSSCASAPKPLSAAAPAAPAPLTAAAAVAPAAASSPKPAEPPAIPAGKKIKSSGEVAAVDPAAGTVTVAARGRKAEFRIGRGAALTKGGAWSPLALSEVRAGDRVSIAFTGDVLISLHVKVGVASPAAGKVARSR